MFSPTFSMSYSTQFYSNTLLVIVIDRSTNFDQYYLMNFNEHMSRHPVYFY